MIKNASFALFGLVLIGLFGLAMFINFNRDKQGSARIRFVAIGDSYTIGEGASETQSWPAVMTRNLQRSGVDIELVSNPSRTGFTTQDAIVRELPVFENAEPDFATLLIGVNDWVQGVSPKKFRERFALLVDRMLPELPNKERLLIVTIPDFAGTPAGANFGAGRDISRGIAGFNAIITEEATRRGLKVIDIYTLSQTLNTEAQYIALDDLHPSAQAYAEWEKLIYPAALELLQ